MNFLSNLADSIPVVGHVKGVIHYAAGDTEGGNKAMYQATRTTAVLGAGAAGSLAGPGGAVVAAMYAGAITDSVASVAMDEPQGLVKGCKNIAEDLNEGKNPMGSIASTGFQVGMDGLGGLGMGGVSSAASQVSGKAVAKGAENIAKTAVKTVGEKAIQKTVKMTGEEVVKTVTKTVTEKAVKKVIETAAVQAEIALVSTHVCIQADERTKKEEREKRDREEREREERQRRDRERREREERERREREERERRAREERQQQEQRAREQQEQRAREEQEQRAREQQEQRAREEQGQRVREQQERRAREQQEQRAREQQEQRAREQQEQRAREQQEQRAREEQEQRVREQQERRAREQQEQRAREQQEQRARERQEQRAREEQEQRVREQQEQRAREQQEQRVRERLQHRVRELVEQYSTPVGSSGSSQPPQGNRNNNNKSRKNKLNYFAIFKNLLEEILDVIFGVERPYTRARSCISEIFRGLSKGQKDYLGKIIERLYKDGILVEVLILVIRIFSEHFPEDISFTNFLSLTEFVAVYILEEIDYRTEVFRMDEEISRENDSSIPKEKPENLRAAIISIIMNLADFVSRIVDIFVTLRFDIESELMPLEISEILLVIRDLSPNFRDVFSAIYHYFKHRCVPGDGVLSVREYYDWIRRVLVNLERHQDYRNLLQDRSTEDVRANVRFEMYVPIFNRRIRIVVNIHRNSDSLIIVLASCYILDKTNDGDEEGMVWIEIKIL